MHTKGYGNIPGELFYYITFLTRALPLRIGAQKPLLSY